MNDRHLQVCGKLSHEELQRILKAEIDKNDEACEAMFHANETGMDPVEDFDYRTGFYAGFEQALKFALALTKFGTENDSK